MSRFPVVLLCATTVFAVAAPAQLPSQVPAPKLPFVIEPIRVSAGAVLTFHLQTRLRHTSADPLDALPHGTVLHVKILNSLDSAVDRDGTEFRGTVVSNLAMGSGIVVHSDSKVRGLLVLLRSRKHPDGFRYELLLTQLTDGGKSYPMTASMYSNFFDSGSRSVPVSKSEPKETPAAPTSAVAGLPASSVQ